MQHQRPEHIPEEDWASLQAGLSQVTSDQGGVRAADLMGSDPTKLGNDPKLEMQWAEKAFKYAETYMKLLRGTADKSKMRLTRLDDDIYRRFRDTFPHLDVVALTEDALKSGAQKLKWRTFCMTYDQNSQLNDYNMGTLLRLHAHGDYDNPDNVTIVPKVQFLAIELARNREGHNASIV